MKLELVSKEADIVRIKVEGEDHTLLNLLRENAWGQKADQATYIVERPYLSTPELVIKGKNAMKILEASVQEIVQQSNDLEKEFSRVLKK
jgi:DNA-directed RNA polymerase subunit L